MQKKKIWENIKDTINIKAFVYVVVLVIYVVIITLIYRFGSAFIASYILILTIISMIIYVLLSKDRMPAVPLKKILGEKELGNIARLLRYAAAVLSFISLMTTARGLQDFVFSDNEAWLAYLASFAVQAILICFSLTYCSLHAVIRRLTTLSDRGKALMISALTIFLAFAFMVSSCFSFSYIANNAYAQSWANDGEIMIEQYLNQEITALSNENRRIGSLLYKEIESHNQLLSNVISEYIILEDEKLSGTLSTFELSAYDHPNQDYGLEDSITNSWIQRYPAYEEEIKGLIDRFKSCAGDLEVYCTKYDEISKQLNNLDVADSDWESIEEDIKAQYDELTQLKEDITALIGECEGLYISAIDRDISPYRSSLKSSAERFQNFINNQIEKVDSLKTEVHNAAEGYSAAGNGDSLSDKIENLQKEIYLLNSTYETAGSKNSNSADVDNIIAELYNILTEYQNDDILSSETIREILELEVLIKEYKKYINLDNQITEYINSNLMVTYNITESGEEEETADSVANVSYDVWISQRDQSFLQFSALLKELPAEPDLLEIALSEDAADESGNNISADADNTKYVSEDVLHEANILRRDLLGEITDFERAFNYFKYDFTVMAFFSAFIAVFFDLGAFLTGCFMYGIKHIKKDAKNK